MAERSNPEEVALRSEKHSIPPRCASTIRGRGFARRSREELPELRANAVMGENLTGVPAREYAELRQRLSRKAGDKDFIMKPLHGYLPRRSGFEKLSLKDQVNTVTTSPHRRSDDAASHRLNDAIASSSAIDVDDSGNRVLLTRQHRGGRFGLKDRGNRIRVLSDSPQAEDASGPTYLQGK